MFSCKGRVLSPKRLPNPPLLPLPLPPLPKNPLRIFAPSPDKKLENPDRNDEPDDDDGRLVVDFVDEAPLP